MIVKLLPEHHLEFLSLIKGCRGLSESTLAEMSNCWKSHATAHICFFLFLDILELHGRLFDHKPVLQGHISSFVKEFEVVSLHITGIFLVFSGPPVPMEISDLKKNPNPKKSFFCFVFLKNYHSVTTHHTSYNGDNLLPLYNVSYFSFNIMAIYYV